MKWIIEIDHPAELADLWIREHAGKEIHLSVGDGCGGGHAIMLSREEIERIHVALGAWLDSKERAG